MEMSLAALSNIHILTLSLGIVAAVLLACAIFEICALKKLKKREDKLLRSDVYVHVPRPKKKVEQEDEPKPEEGRKKREKAKTSDGRPKRGKKTKRLKYVFVSDISAPAENESAPAENGASSAENDASNAENVEAEPKGLNGDGDAHGEEGGETPHKNADKKTCDEEEGEA